MFRKLPLTIFFSLLAFIPASYAQNDLDAWLGKPTEYTAVLVKNVEGTDTVTVEGEEGDEKIRLIGLRSIDMSKHNMEKRDEQQTDQYGFKIEQPADPLGSIEEKAMEFMAELLLGKKVRLEFDADKNEIDFSTPAYIYLTEGNIFVNEEILRQGFADLQIRPPNTKHEKILRAAYQEAREEKRGIHNY